MMMPRVWSNPRYHFDNVVSATRVLFECATTEGFLDVMYSMMDVTAVGLQPVREYSPGYCVYMIFFILVGSFFIIQLFIGVTIESYNQSSGMAFKTVEQHSWQVMTKQIDDLRFVKPQLKAPKTFLPRLRKPFFRVSVHPLFDLFMMSCILLNTLFMMTEHYPTVHISPTITDLDLYDTWVDVLEVANFIFLIIFTVEMGVKLIGLGPRQYVADAWNDFDAVVVVGSWVLKYVGVGALASVARIFRLFRVIRLVKKAKSIQTLFKTLISSVPSMSYICMLMFLCYFVFAVIGVQLFSNVRYGGALTHHNNFQTFGMAMLLLFRASTGEDWQRMMTDLDVSAPDCVQEAFNVTLFQDKDNNKLPDDPDETFFFAQYSDCGMPYAPVVYFVLFYMIISFTFMNLFVAVILDKFVTCLSDQAEVVSAADMEEYIEAWRKYLEQEQLPVEEYMPIADLRGFFTYFRTHYGPEARGGDLIQTDNRGQHHPAGNNGSGGGGGGTNGGGGGTNGGGSGSSSSSSSSSGGGGGGGVSNSSQLLSGDGGAPGSFLTVSPGSRGGELQRQESAPSVRKRSFAGVAPSASTSHTGGSSSSPAGTDSDPGGDESGVASGGVTSFISRKMQRPNALACLDYIDYREIHHAYYERIKKHIDEVEKKKISDAMIARYRAIRSAQEVDAANNAAVGGGEGSSRRRSKFRLSMRAARKSSKVQPREDDSNPTQAATFAAHGKNGEPSTKSLLKMQKSMGIDIKQKKKKPKPPLKGAKKGTTKRRITLIGKLQARDPGNGPKREVHFQQLLKVRACVLTK